MVTEGTFPFAREEIELEGAPRVGDGVIVLDADSRIRYASPNAVSSLHRMGIHAYTSGVHLREIGFDEGRGRHRGPRPHAGDRGGGARGRVDPRPGDPAARGPEARRRADPAARRDRPPPPRPDADVEGRDDPRDPPPGEEQPADDRVAAAPAGSSGRLARGAPGDRGVGATDPVDRDRARDAVPRGARGRRLQRDREAARARRRGVGRAPRTAGCASRSRATRASCRASWRRRSRSCSTS